MGTLRRVLAAAALFASGATTLPHAQSEEVESQEHGTETHFDGKVGIVKSPDLVHIPVYDEASLAAYGACLIDSIQGMQIEYKGKILGLLAEYVPDDGTATSLLNLQQLTEILAQQRPEFEECDDASPSF